MSWWDQKTEAHDLVSAERAMHVSQSPTRAIPFARTTQSYNHASPLSKTIRRNAPFSAIFSFPSPPNDQWTPSPIRPQCLPIRAHPRFPPLLTSPERPDRGRAPMRGPHLPGLELAGDALVDQLPCQRPVVGWRGARPPGRWPEDPEGMSLCSDQTSYATVLALPARASFERPDALSSAAPSHPPPCTRPGLGDAQAGRHRRRRLRARLPA